MCPLASGQNLSPPRLVAIVEAIGSVPRRIKRLTLLVGLASLVMPAGGSSLASFGGPALNHTYWPRWSPNGKRLAFVSFARAGQSLEFVNATGTGLVKPARGWFADEPEWSPRGAKLAFVGGRLKTHAQGLWTIDTATGVRKRLTMSQTFDPNSRLAWSPNGSKIAFGREIVNFGFKIYTVGVHGGSQQLVAWGQRPDWSPDGKELIFDRPVSFIFPTEPNLYVVNADGSGARLLADSASEARFSPDGRQIVFDRGGEIWTMNADGSDQEQLTQVPETDWAPVWSPNGRQIAFLHGSSLYQLYVMNVDGSGQRQLAPSTGEEFEPDWSPNGTRIAYARCASGAFRSCRVQVAKVG